MEADELRQSGRTQGSPRRLTIEADVLLQQLRRNKRSFAVEILWGESLLLIGLVIEAAVFAVFGLSGLRQGLPGKVIGGLFSMTLICLAVAGFKGFDRLQQMRRRLAIADPILACIEEHLALVRHEIWLWSKQAFRWYLLPLGAGVALLVVNVAWAVGKWEALLTFSTLASVIGIAAFMWAGRWFLGWCVRKFLEPRQRELEAVLRNLSGESPPASPGG